MKRWIGILFVCLFLGTLWLGTISTTPVAATNPPSPYTFYVRVIYNDTLQPAPNIEVVLEDLTTGSSCSKWTNSGGSVSFNLPADLEYYSDGDSLKIFHDDPPSSYTGCELVIIGDSTAWDTKLFTLPLYPKPSSETKKVGWMYLTDGTPQITFTNPETVTKKPGEYVYFYAGETTSYHTIPSNYPAARYVDVYYTIIMLKRKLKNGEFVWEETDRDSYHTIRPIPDAQDPPVTVCTNTAGVYKFSLQITYRYLDYYQQPITNFATCSLNSGEWKVL